MEDQSGSCWRCASPKPVKVPAASPVRQVSWRFFLFAVPMSVAAPVLADCLQSFPVVRRGYIIYQAWLFWYSDDGGNFNFTRVAVMVGIRVAITLLLLWFWVKRGFDGRVVWLCFVVCWIVLDIVLEPAVRR